MSAMWMWPSMTGSISTNAPKEVRLRTLPLMRMPTGYFWGSAIQGSSSVCFMPSESFSSLGPRHVCDVDVAVDDGLDLHERAEGGEVAHLALDAHAHRILLGQRHPGVFLGLLH